MFLVLKTSRMLYIRLIMAERGQKSMCSDRRTYLEAPAQAPGRCVHQGKHLNRGNQYATWTVCHDCGARLSYSSRRQGKAKAKTKAAAAAPSVTTAYRAPQPPLLSSGPASSTSAKNRTEGAIQPESHVPTELTSALTAMTLGFQQMSSSLQDLARGQAHMLAMMERAGGSAHHNLDVEAATGMAARMAQQQVAQETFDMTVDDEGSPDSWSQVLPNPNDQDLPSSSQQ